MSFQIEGTLVVDLGTEQKTDNFQAREFVMQIPSGERTEVIKFQLVQDRVYALDDFEVGDTIVVHFDLRGREWNGKYFTNLNAWRLESPDGSKGISNKSPRKASASKSAPKQPVTTDVDDEDLPW